MNTDERCVGSERAKREESMWDARERGERKKKEESHKPEHKGKERGGEKKEPWDKGKRMREVSKEKSEKGERVREEGGGPGRGRTWLPEMVMMRS